MVMLRATKNLKYGTRRMVAGDEFDARPRDAKILKAIKKAENAPAAPPRRGRPPKVSEPEPETATVAEPVAVDPFAGIGVAELRTMIEGRGVELPDHYVRRSELIAMLGGEG